jgi:hypothetical protein
MNKELPILKRTATHATFFDIQDLTSVLPLFP